jgi:leader peptidase (prepilin peptidase)/N-methyltransferase
MGLGDVKLAPTFGLTLGWLSWGTVAVGVFAGFLLGGLAGLAPSWSSAHPWPGRA